MGSKRINGTDKLSAISETGVRLLVFTRSKTLMESNKVISEFSNATPELTNYWSTVYMMVSEFFEIVY